MNEMSSIPSGSSAALSRSYVEIRPASSVTETQATTSENKLARQSAAANPQEPAAAPPERPTRAQLADTTQELNKQFSGFNTGLQFSVDDDSGDMVVKVIDKESQEVIRQIPPEKALALAKYLREMESDQSQALALDKRGNGLQNSRATLEGLLIHVKA